MSQPKVSIIVATYNAEKTLNIALDSIIQQSFHEWECIIIDGCSKDKTVDIIKEYVYKDSRVKYISEPDKGIYDAYNKGWKLANGKWIYYLGADDILEENAFDIFENRDSKADIIYGNIKLKSRSTITLKKYTILPDYFKKHMASHQAIIMRRDVLKDINGFNLKYHICADFDLLQRAYLQGYKFLYYDITFATFTIADGISSKNCFKPPYEAFKIRYKNQSINVISNIYYSIISCIKRCAGMVRRKLYQY